MQKFTVFSIILSISVLLILGDLVANRYLGKKETPPADTTSTEEIQDSETLKEEYLVEEQPLEECTTENELCFEEEAVDLSSEIDLNVLTPYLGEELFASAGFLDPTLKDTIYSGYVFQFLPFSDPSAFVYQWNLFDGESYIGSVYEIKYSNETASFQGYLALRDTGTQKADVGTLNEVNNYGDASFYFNHTAKTQTVHLVVRRGDSVFGFEYPYKNHETMKKLLETSLQKSVD